jgi:rod shape-determining protein MreC
MFSKKTMVAAGLVILIVGHAGVFSFQYIRKTSIGDPAARVALSLVSPVQETISAVTDFTSGLWRHYFFLIAVAQRNNELEKKLALALVQNNACKEALLENERLRSSLGLKAKIPFKLVAAEVVARDASPWYQTIVINKGEAAGIVAGLPVVMPEGIVGHVMTASAEYAKVLLMLDRNSAVDAIIQRTRARGITRGAGDKGCIFDFALRTADIRVGDTVFSSGLDGIYPKGLPVGHVSRVVRRNAGLFQEIELIPYVDFTKLEEVMIIINPLKPNANGN